MAGSSFQPPVTIDPTQSNSDQTSFINQNFQAIASALETNSFRVVDTATVTFTGSTSTGGTINKTIAHNLGYAPIAFVFYTFGSQQGMWFGPLGVSNSAGNVIFSTWLSFSTDATNLYINYYYGGAGSSGTVTENVIYYLVQQTAG